MAPKLPDEQRLLLFVPSNGLGNRLQALLSSVALAEATNRTVVVAKWWGDACPFERFFELAPRGSAPQRVRVEGELESLRGLLARRQSAGDVAHVHLHDPFPLDFLHSPDAPGLVVLRSDEFFLPSVLRRWKGPLPAWASGADGAPRRVADAAAELLRQTLVPSGEALRRLHGRGSQECRHGLHLRKAGPVPLPGAAGAAEAAAACSGAGGPPSFDFVASDAPLAQAAQTCEDRVDALADALALASCTESLTLTEGSSFSFAATLLRRAGAHPKGRSLFFVGPSGDAASLSCKGPYVNFEHVACYTQSTFDAAPVALDTSPCADLAYGWPRSLHHPPVAGVAFALAVVHPWATATACAAVAAVAVWLWSCRRRRALGSSSVRQALAVAAAVFLIARVALWEAGTVLMGAIGAVNGVSFDAKAF